MNIYESSKLQVRHLKLQMKHAKIYDKADEIFQIRYAKLHIEFEYFTNKVCKNPVNFNWDKLFWKILITDGQLLDSECIALKYWLNLFFNSYYSHILGTCKKCI